MNKKENEAVVNRFLLSSLYYIVGLFAIYGIYKFSQSLTGWKLIFEGNMFLWLIAVCVIGLIVAVVRKNVYYAVMSVALAICLALLHFYWPVITEVYTRMDGRIANILTRSYVPYAGSAVIITALYVYECVYYALNVRSK
ncbi:MAG: hypothetical protein J6A69_08775 [Clostridia bacterium]|nr:hypothetical protein [Clostridia bacterium]